MIALALLFAQYDPLPPPPPPDPGQPFQPAQPAPPPPPAPPPARTAPPAYRPAPDPYVKPDRPEPPPQSHRGFQLAVRSGVALPAGRLSESTAMAGLASAQIPAFLDIGAKVTRHLFIGGYGSLGLGGVSDRWERRCSDKSDCSSRSMHIGAQIQYHFAPAERVSPWIGYGVGYEWLWTQGHPETTYHGPEYGRFMLGVDARLSRELGFGPFVDATFARYTRISYEQDFRGASSSNAVVTSTDIDDTSTHSWVTIGLRLVLYP